MSAPIATSFLNAISATRGTDLLPQILELYSTHCKGYLCEPDKIHLITFSDNSTAIMLADREDIEVFSFEPEDADSILDWFDQNPSYAKTIDRLICSEIKAGRLSAEILT